MKGMWKTYRLGDICKKIGSGATPRGGKVNYLDSGISFIRSQNVYNLRFQMEGLVFIGEEAAQKLQSVTVEPGDILLNITGDSVARTCQVPQEILPARVNQHVLIVRPNHDLVSSFFLSYVLASPQMQAEMLNLAVGKGASRNALTKEMVEALCISLPPLEEQERIAGVLGAYDDLIAVNERRMVLLEEAAHRLYRDRFVTHANSDWPLRPLGEVAPLRRGKIITEATAQPGCVPVVAGGLEPAYWHNQANTTAPVLTVAGSGANAGFARLYYEDVWASDCSYVDRSEQAPVYFAYCFLKDNKRKIENFKRGAAQPHVYPADLNALEGHFDRESIQTFEAQVSPYFEAIGVLARENVLLREGRDKLLPRLLREEA